MIKEIAEQFIGKSNSVEIKLIGGGNINKSYLVDSDIGKYILQRINTDVFAEPSVVMSNILKVCAHLKSKKIETLTFLKRTDADAVNDCVDNYLVKEGYFFWRCMRFIKNSGQCDCASDSKLANLTGYAFGKFILDCSDMNAILTPSIPDFHNLPNRIRVLNEIYHKGKWSIKNKRAEIVRKKLLTLIGDVNCSLRNNLPDRITHNDTKIANLLFDEDKITVIDLDTVMAGKITDDFGDSARSVASSAVEDETDLSKIRFNIEKFSTFAAGFSRGISDLLTMEEIKALPFAPAYVTAELACRFLADYYNDDKYFITLYPEHNLDRARNQTILLEDILNKRYDIENAIKKYF